tara:strand:+ start:905 stop:1093 length:189 start_codon:yes stop_codon:yes gene_type:complete
MIKLELTEKEFHLIEQAMDCMVQEMMAEEDNPKETWYYDSKTRKLWGNVTNKMHKIREQTND